MLHRFPHHLVMRRAVWALALCLVLTGCAGRTEWTFRLETRDFADDYTARDGTMLSWYALELPRLTLEGRGAEPPAEKAAVRDAFNARVEHDQELLLREYHDLEQLAIASYSGDGGEDSEPPGERAAVSCAYQTARLLSVRADGYVDWGGAHPLPFVLTWNFDLAEGRFVGWRDMTDRPDALRAAVASEIAAQIAADAGRYFPDAAARAGTLEGAALYFEEDGVHAVFSVYDIAPYAAGTPEFTLPYDVLAPYWNDYGRELLKKAG